jgi:cyclic pyranopterin phosphate synthase
MDVGNNNGWRRDRVFSGADVMAVLQGEFDLEPVPGATDDTARRYRCARTGAEFGFVNSITAPFCRGCNRMRLSADGQLFTCLFARAGHDLRALLRGGLDGEAIAEIIRAIWTGRDDRYSEVRAAIRPAPRKVEMSYIGG